MEFEANCRRYSLIMKFPDKLESATENSILLVIMTY